MPIKTRRERGAAIPVIRPAADYYLDCRKKMAHLDEILSCTAYDINGTGRFGGLPEAAQAYVRRVEELIGTPVRWISIGPRREQLICLDG